MCVQRYVHRYLCVHKYAYVYIYIVIYLCISIVCVYILMCMYGCGWLCTTIFLCDVVLSRIDLVVYVDVKFIIILVLCCCCSCSCCPFCLCSLMCLSPNSVVSFALARGWMSVNNHSRFLIKVDDKFFSSFLLFLFFALFSDFVRSGLGTLGCVDWFEFALFMVRVLIRVSGIRIRSRSKRRK